MGSPKDFVVNLTARLAAEPTLVRLPKPQRTYSSFENSSRCSQVDVAGLKTAVYSQRPPSVEAPTSRSLKFGVDRILSDDIAPSKKVQSDKMAALPPCSECVSSLLRCCRLSSPTEYYRSYYPSSAVLHTPKPIRPYTNLILESDVTDRGSLTQSGSLNKRKRSWSRAVFSNLQRKGLEKRFQIQKYITKPDRRQLAATLGLTDAQVKVWFQNRRMKWRHSKELKFHNGTNFQGSTIVDPSRPDVKTCSPPISNHDDSKDRK